MKANDPQYGGWHEENVCGGMCIEHQRLRAQNSSPDSSSSHGSSYRGTNLGASFLGKLVGFGIIVYVILKFFFFR